MTDAEITAAVRRTLDKLQDDGVDSRQWTKAIAKAVPEAGIRHIQAALELGKRQAEQSDADVVVATWQVEEYRALAHELDISTPVMLEDIIDLCLFRGGELAKRAVYLRDSFPEYAELPPDDDPSPHAATG